MIGKHHEEKDMPKINEITAGPEPRSERQLDIEGQEQETKQRAVAEESNRIVVGGIADLEQAYGRVQNIRSECCSPDLQADGSQHGLDSEHARQRPERHEREPEWNIAHADLLDQALTKSK